MKDKIRIYISGPIRGRADYKERFADAAAAIKGAGYTCVNPALLSLVIPDKSDDWYLDYDEYLITLCDAIVFLPGSEKSQGCQRERKMARFWGLQLYDMATDTFKEDWT